MSEAEIIMICWVACIVLAFAIRGLAIVIEEGENAWAYFFWPVAIVFAASLVAVGLICLITKAFKAGQKALNTGGSDNG